MVLKKAAEKKSGAPVASTDGPKPEAKPEPTKPASTPPPPPSEPKVTPPTAQQVSTAGFWTKAIAEETSAAALVRTIKAMRDDAHTGRLTQGQLGALLEHVTQREATLKSGTPAQRGEADQEPPEGYRSDADEGDGR